VERVEQAVRKFRIVGEMVALVAVYVATAKVGLSFDALAGVATTVWPPTGVAIAAVCLRGRRMGLAIFVAASVVNALTGIPWWATLIIATGNTLEALAAGEMLRRLHWRREMDRVQDVVAWTVVALLATTVSATFGTTAIGLAHIVVKDGTGQFWLVWWVGDVLGAVLVAPAVFAWSRGGWRPSRRLTYWIEGAVLGALLVLVSSVVFYDIFPHKVVRLARGSYSMWPLLIWAVVRFRQRGAVLALLVVSFIAISGTAAGHGLFAGGLRAPTPHERLFRVQCFMAVTTISMMLLAAALDERRQAILARDEFISIASHELKTPLTALRLRLGTALRTLDAGPAPLSVDEADKIARAVAGASAMTERLTRLVDDLLDVSRLTAGRLDLSLDEIPLRDMLGEIVARLQEQAAEAGSAITLDVDAPTPEIVALWDRGRIEQVITNLLSNAIKYGSGREIALTARAGGERIVVTVRDRGIGIAKADQERIFQAFERVESAHRVGGLGLGLYIGRQIVTAHGGSLRVSSEPGRGSTFVLDLPRTVKTSTADPNRDR
jgi:signal transduction histidine kinase